MPSLFATSLDQTSLAEAYPLIRCATKASLTEWEDFAKHLGEQGGGIVAVRAEDGRVHGVAAYMPIASLKHGQVLRVDSIATFEFGHSSPVREALSIALDELAAAQGCNAVLIGIDAAGHLGASQSQARRWEALGLTADTIEFVRTLPGTAKPTSRRRSQSRRQSPRAK